MVISAHWSFPERFEVAKVLSRGSHEDKKHTRDTALSSGRMRRAMRLICSVLNETAQELEVNRQEIIMEYERRLAEKRGGPVT